MYKEDHEKFSPATGGRPFELSIIIIIGPNSTRFYNHNSHTYNIYKISRYAKIICFYSYLKLRVYFFYYLQRKVEF